MNTKEFIVTDSNNIKKIEYSKEEKELVVLFKNNRRYKYMDVEESEFTKFCDAESKGSFFQSHINKSYAFKRLPDHCEQSNNI